MKKVLVAYFSATGTTKALAETLAKEVKGDVFEIVPETPYSSADLNWQNSQSRSSLEMKDRSARPAIRTQVADMAAYDTVFLGFPIWWYREPSIIDTFLEAYDFSGKTVVLFATSGGSGLGDSANNLQALAPGAKVVNGKRFSAGAAGKELAAWAEAWL